MPMANAFMANYKCPETKGYGHTRLAATIDHNKFRIIYQRYTSKEKIQIQYTGVATS